MLDDADAYPRWVVGARRLRRVDADWPHEGSEFHHAIGIAGAELHDSSEVLEHNRPTGSCWRSGSARPAPRGSRWWSMTADDGTAVTMEETPNRVP